ncbi:hypothetical protein BXZ70DRAFT_1012481 [Cristinia sonorae]|uniref:Uncharacterized protein n=1 Tax=Cristinia sonorae TaxID=1940300 RepID=A0A8K0UGP4_9AGAR|nr:hypothetical protein BXZ70DRAFT_1012481 [Cristinia sonorae]
MRNNLNPYKIARLDVDVEGLISKLAKYYMLGAEDSEVINTDPTARRARADIANGVQLQSCLASAIHHASCIINAVLVPRQYKLSYPPVDHPDLRLFRKITDTAYHRANAWIQKGTLGARKDSNAQPSAQPAPRRMTPRRRPRSIAAPPSLRLRLSEVDAYLNAPNKMFGLRFRYLLSDPESSELWELHSVVSMASSTKYVVAMDGCDSNLPMERESLRSMMLDSCIVHS